jgi:hypothetical protein
VSDPRNRREAIQKHLAGVRAKAGDPNKLSFAEVYEYDTDRGVLSATNEFLRTEVEIRAGVVEKITRQAAIFELERLGYTVISPEEP